MAKNVEIKARVADLSRLREIALELGARPAGVLSQVDRYFEIAGGRRVKLREIGDVPPFLPLRQDAARRPRRKGRKGGTSPIFELIRYDRPEAAGVRTSDYTVERLEPGDPALAVWRARAAHPIVVKARELLLLDNVRIHLDRVDGLGTFLELEAVVDPAHDEVACRDAVDRLLAAFGIEPDALLRASYSDLLLRGSR